jgi:hypothetical protein
MTSATLVHCKGTLTSPYSQAVPAPHQFPSHFKQSAGRTKADVESIAVTLALSESFNHIFASLGHTESVASEATASDFVLFLATIQHEFRSEAVRENAEAAAASFQWPPSLLSRDTDSLSRLGSISAVIDELHSERNASGFNETRVRKLFSQDPSFPTLLEVARVGAVIDTSESFTRISASDQQRPITHDMPKTLGTHAMKFLEKKRAILLDAHQLSPMQHQELSYVGVHVSYKADDPLGRFCLDPSNTPNHIEPLNGPGPKEASIARYGKIDHPLMQEILHRWCVWREAEGMPWSEVWIHKNDVSSAFPQFSMSAESAKLLAVMISASLILIFICGSFGWCGAPMVFDLIGRAFFHLILQRVIGPCDRYVDDVFGIGNLVSAAHDDSIVQNVIRETFGTDAVAVDKHLLDQVAVILGWQVSMPLNEIRPSDRGIRKIAFVFFSFDVSKPQPVSLWQRLASIARRYSASFISFCKSEDGCCTISAY